MPATESHSIGSPAPAVTLRSAAPALAHSTRQIDGMSAIAGQSSLEKPRRALVVGERRAQRNGLVDGFDAYPQPLRAKAFSLQNLSQNGPDMDLQSGAVERTFQPAASPDSYSNSTSHSNESQTLPPHAIGSAAASASGGALHSPSPENSPGAEFTSIFTRLNPALLRADIELAKTRVARVKREMEHFRSDLYRQAAARARDSPQRAFTYAGAESPLSERAPLRRRYTDLAPGEQAADLAMGDRIYSKNSGSRRNGSFVSGGAIAASPQHPLFSNLHKSSRLGLARSLNEIREETEGAPPTSQNENENEDQYSTASSSTQPLVGRQAALASRSAHHRVHFAAAAAAAAAAEFGETRSRAHTQNLLFEQQSKLSYSLPTLCFGPSARQPMGSREHLNLSSQSIREDVESEFAPQRSRGVPIHTAEQKPVATDSGRFSQKEDTSSLAASYSPYATAASAPKAPVPPAFLSHQSPPLAASPQFFSLSALGARFSPQPLLDSHAPVSFQLPFPYQPLWSPGANAQLDELRGYRALLLERLKAVDSQLSQLGHIASLIGSGSSNSGGGGMGATRGSLALSKSSTDSDVFSSGTSSRELELLDEETRIGQLRHSYEALRERLQTAAGEEEAAVLRSVMAELEREMHALSSRQQVGLSLAAGDLQANQLALNRFVFALREEREQLVLQIEALTIAESRVSSMRTAATQLYLRPPPESHLTGPLPAACVPMVLPPARGPFVSFQTPSLYLQQPPLNSMASSSAAVREPLSLSPPIAQPMPVPPPPPLSRLAFSQPLQNTQPPASNLSSFKAESAPSNLHTLHSGGGGSNAERKVSAEALTAAQQQQQQTTTHVSVAPPESLRSANANANPIVSTVSLVDCCPPNNKMSSSNHNQNLPPSYEQHVCMRQCHSPPPPPGSSEQALSVPVASQRSSGSHVNTSSAVPPNANKSTASAGGVFSTTSISSSANRAVTSPTAQPQAQAQTNGARVYLTLDFSAPSERLCLTVERLQLARTQAQLPHLHASRCPHAKPSLTLTQTQKNANPTQTHAQLDTRSARTQPHSSAPAPHVALRLVLFAPDGSSSALLSTRYQALVFSHAAAATDSHTAPIASPPAPDPTSTSGGEALFVEQQAAAPKRLTREQLAACALQVALLARCSTCGQECVLCSSHLPLQQTITATAAAAAEVRVPLIVSLPELLTPKPFVPPHPKPPHELKSSSSNGTPPSVALVVSSKQSPSNSNPTPEPNVGQKLAKLPSVTNVAALNPVLASPSSKSEPIKLVPQNVSLAQPAPTPKSSFADKKQVPPASISSLDAHIRSASAAGAGSNAQVAKQSAVAVTPVAPSSTPQSPLVAVASARSSASGTSSTPNSGLSPVTVQSPATSSHASPNGSACSSVSSGGARVKSLVRHINSLANAPNPSANAQRANGIAKPPPASPAVPPASASRSSSAAAAAALVAHADRRMSIDDQNSSEL